MDSLSADTLSDCLAAPLAAETDLPCDEAAARAGRHLRMLAELAEIGMRLAREVERQALAADPPRDALPDRSRSNDIGADRARADLGLVFARIARAVRQTVALEARLASDVEARAAVGTAAQASRAAAEHKRTRQLKDQVRRLAEEAIGAEADGHEAENLRYDLDERLEDPAIEAELGWRPIGVIFAGICRDLGITPDLSHFTDSELGFDAPAMDLPGRSAAKAGLDTADPDRAENLAVVPDLEFSPDHPAKIAGSFDAGLLALPRLQTPWPGGFTAVRDPP